ncbi:hypothetical protein EZS27_018575, partial [termite gut metagenome]
MKKVYFLMAIVVTASIVSCTTRAPKASLTNEADSLAYSMGLAQSQGLRDY